MTNKATLNALKAELEKTIATAQHSLEQYLTASHSLDDWQQCVDAFQQLRGTFSMLEHRGAVLLAEEAVQLLQFLPVDKPQQHEQEYGSLMQAVVLIGKYLEFQQLGQAPYPEILLPVINQLRKARKAAPLREGCFHRFDYTLPETTPSQDQLEPEDVQLLKKYRHMFQAGLLHVLRGDNPRSALRYQALSLRRVQRLLAGTRYGEYWRLAAMAAEGIAASQSDRLPATRRQWFAQIDKGLRTILKEGDKALTRPPTQVLVQDALYFIALTVDDAPRLRVFQEQHPHIRLPYTNRQLQDQIQMMQGPAQSVLDSVSSALQDEFNNIKDTMNLAAQGEADFSAHALRDQLGRVADILDMVGLSSPSNVMRRMWEEVSRWPDNAAPKADDLMRIADSVLYAESAVSRLHNTGQRATAEDSREGARNSYLLQARVAALDEMEAGISVCKRAVSAYMDSQHEALHLNNVPATLNGVRGALIFMDSDEAVAIVDQCIRFVQRLQSERVGVTNEQLDAFADALSSLEFYLEGLLSGQQNHDVIRVAKASLAQLPEH